MRVVLTIVPLFHALFPTVSARYLPKPSGQYYVGQTQHLFNYTTPNDPVAANGTANVTGTNLLITIYYPSETPTNLSETVPYVDPINIDIWGDAFQYPKGALGTIQTWWNFQAPIIAGTAGENVLPTIIFSPGGGMTCWGYSTLLSDFASHGFPVIAIDHPGEAPYLEFPYGGGGKWGIDIYAEWPLTLQQAVFEMRVNDIQAIIHELFPPLVELYGAPFNISSYIALGHSVGGAAAAEAAAREPSILAALNYDGRFFSNPDVQKPVLMMASQGHNSSMDPTWVDFPEVQTGWWEILQVAGAEHLDYSDISLWAELLGVNESTTPQVGPISGFRMIEIVKAYTYSFLGFVLGKGEGLLKGPSKRFPEVSFVNSSSAPVALAST